MSEILRPALSRVQPLHPFIWWVPNPILRGLVAAPDFRTMYDPVRRASLLQVDSAASTADQITPYGVGKSCASTNSTTIGGVQYRDGWPGTEIAGQSARTVMLIIYVDSLAANYGFFSFGDTTANGNLINFYSTGSNRWRLGTGGGYRVWTPTITAGNTYVLVLTMPTACTVADMSLYVNGALAAITTTSGGTTLFDLLTSNALTWGKAGVSTSFTQGGQHVVASALWDRVLTADEIQRVSADPFMVYRNRRVLGQHLGTNGGVILLHYYYGNSK